MKNKIAALLILVAQGVLADDVPNSSMDDPLADKRWGVEVNVVRLLGWGEDGGQDTKDFSGTISYFPVNQPVEIAFPIYWANFKDTEEDQNLQVRTVDAHYRYFMGNRRGGFYISGFGRLAVLDGTLGDDFDLDSMDGDAEYREDRTVKFGIGMGVGQRIFSRNGIYWGWSISYGRYVLGDSDRYARPNHLMDDDDEDIIDAEFAKIGWAF